MPSGGCIESSPWEKIDGIIDRACPVVYLHEYYQIFEAYTWFVNDRVLPYGGGRLEQPYLIMEYLNLIRSIVGGRKD
jgi:hypothetical protein